MRIPYRFWIPLLAAALVASACAASSPAAPTPPAGSGSSTLRAVDGSTVSAIDGRPVPSVTVRIGDRSAMSDSTGTFHVDNLGDGSLPAVLSSPSTVERRLMIPADSTERLRASLIPSTFDLAAFDQMFRGTGQLQRVQTAPSLVVLTTVMNYETAFSDGDEYHATSEQLTDAETSLLIEHLTEALGILTGNTFTSFASIELESAPSGSRVSTNRPGKTVIGRYRGLQAIGNTIGMGRWVNDAQGAVTGGAVFLDRDFDKTNEMRRLLRTHELGHALGYLHVTTRTSIMNPTIGPEVTTFDRDGAMIAFQRKPGNLSPDADPSGAPAPARNTGGIFGGTILCGPASKSR